MEFLQRRFDCIGIWRSVALKQQKMGGKKPSSNQNMKQCWWHVWDGKGNVWANYSWHTAVHLKTYHPFTNKCAGVDWLKGFLRRHQNLSVRTPEATSISRAVSFNQLQIATFYNVLKEVLDNTHADALKIWNMVETGLNNVHKPVNITATKDVQTVEKITVVNVMASEWVVS